MFRILSALLIYLVCISNAFAFHTEYGYMPYGYRFTVDDPNGPTDSSSGINALGFSVRFEPDKLFRYVFNTQIIDTKFDASVSNIGQGVHSIQFSGLYERNLRLSRRFNNLYAGVGVFIGNTSIDKRYQVDSAGFLINTYPSRNFQDYGAVLSISQGFHISRSFDLDVGAMYQKSLNNGLNGLQIGVSFYYF